jgi:hypothetical protein
MLSTELRDTIQDFIAAKITIAQLEDWLVPRLPYFYRFPNTADADVVSAVELGLAEMTNGIRDKDEVRKDLKRVLETNNAVLAFYHQGDFQNIESVSTNTTSHLVYAASFQSIMTAA